MSRTRRVIRYFIKMGYQLRGVKGQSPDQGRSPILKKHVTARQSRRLTSGGEAVASAESR